MKSRLALLVLAALVVVGLAAYLGFKQSGASLVDPVIGVAATSTNCCYIQLTNDQKVTLDGFRSALADLWSKVNEQKSLLYQQINPGLEKIYGSHAHPISGTLEEHEFVYQSSPLFEQITKLQGELARLEADTLTVANQINSFEQALLASNSGKQLDKAANNALNGLRHKVSMILELIGDVYNDDPPCPDCPP